MLLSLFFSVTSFGSLMIRLLVSVVVVQLLLHTRQVTRATHVRNRVCPRVELILKCIIILLIIFLGVIKSKPCESQTIKVKKMLFPTWGLNSDPCTPQPLTS